MESKIRRTDLFLIIVLYNCKLETSQTYNSILKNNSFLNLNGVIYDNSVESQDIKIIPSIGDFEYKHNPENPGLAEAYNFALKRAVELKSKWLVLLDQDTYITADYLDQLANFDSNNHPDVVINIPVVKSFDKEKLISPSMLRNGGFKPFNDIIYGVQNEKISGINSGTLINIDFLNSINQFNLLYPLDMLDHWYFREVYRRKKLVNIFNCEIFQNLSVQDGLEKNMSIKRYVGFVKAENLFFRTDSLNQYLLYKLRLIFRIFKQLRYKNKGYWKETLKILFVK